MRVGVTGSRRRSTDLDRGIIFRALDDFVYPEIVSGGCKKGADAFAKEYAEQMGLEYVEYLPLTSPPARNYGEAVQRYYDRNERIAMDCDVLVALVAPDRKGGTENTIAHAERLGKPVHIL